MATIMATITISYTEAERRVRERAVPLLDAHGPENWRELVDLDALSMASMTGCVLGQLYGHFSNGAQELWPHMDFRNLADRDRWQWAMWYGFDADWQRDNSDAVTYDELDAAWRAALGGGS